MILHRPIRDIGLQRGRGGAVGLAGAGGAERVLGEAAHVERPGEIGFELQRAVIIRDRRLEIAHAEMDEAAAVEIGCLRPVALEPAIISR